MDAAACGRIRNSRPACCGRLPTHRGAEGRPEHAREAKRVRTVSPLMFSNAANEPVA